jgi:hypothetical protein
MSRTFPFVESTAEVFDLIELEFQQDCQDSKTSKFATSVLLTLDLNNEILPTDTLLELVEEAFLDTFNAMNIFTAKVRRSPSSRTRPKSSYFTR